MSYRLKKTILFSLIVLFITYPFFAQSTDSTVLKQRTDFINSCKQYIGTPYVYGGLNTEGIDCSGLIYVCARDTLNINLPRIATDIYSYVQIIPEEQKEPGDLLFFKTTDSGISHVAVYIGNKQFIHAASDGPNTGVITSSLNEAYWGRTYSCAGRFLPPLNVTPQSNETIKEVKQEDTPSTISTKKNFYIDTTAFFVWNFLEEKNFSLIARGGEFQAKIRYFNNSLNPGCGIFIRWDAKMNVIQLPVVFTLSIADIIHFYAGPVFTFGNAVLPGTEEPINPSLFPGIIGISWQSPNLPIGAFGLSFVQDISYTVHNATDGAALSPLKSIIAGILLQTGIRLTFPAL